MNVKTVICLVLAAGVLDVAVTTYMWNTPGFAELNPIARWLHDKAGGLGLAAAKLAAVVMFCIALLLIPRKERSSKSQPFVKAWKVAGLAMATLWTFGAILGLATQPATALSVVDTLEQYQTDNLLRVFGDQLIVTTQSETCDFTYCNRIDSLTSPLGGNLTTGTPRVGCGLLTIDGCISSRIRAWGVLTDGATLPGADASNKNGAFYPSLMTLNESDAASQPENITVMNVTFGCAGSLGCFGNIPATNLAATFSCCIAFNQAGSGEAYVWASLRDINDVEVRAFNFTTIGCTAPASPSGGRIKDATVNFPETQIKTLQLRLNHTNCVFANDVSGSRLGLLRLGLWSTGNQSAIELLSSAHTVFADYIKAQEPTYDGNGNAGDNNVTNIANLSVELDPVSSYWVYVGGTCVHGGGGGDPTPFCDSTDGSGKAVWPGPLGPGYGGTGNSCLKVNYRGASSDGQNKWVNIFRVTNSCGIKTLLRFAGTVENNARGTAFDKHRFYTGNAYNGPGGDYRNAGTKPLAAKCFCMSAAPNGTIALAFKETSGGLGTLPAFYGEMFKTDTNFDLGKATLTTLVNGDTGAQANTSKSVNITYNVAVQEGHWGNAWYFNIVIINNTETPSFTCPDILLDGNTIKGELGRFGPNNGIIMCPYLVEDFVRKLNLGPGLFDAPGTHGGLMGWTGQTFSHKVEIPAWPKNLQPPNGGVNGYPLWAIASIDGKKAERISCQPGGVLAASAGLCSGNHNTTGLTLAGTFTTVAFNLRVCDQGTKAVNINTFDSGGFLAGVKECKTFFPSTNVNISGALITESVSGGLASTNSTGQANLNLTSGRVNLTFFKERYRIAFLNFSATSYPTFNVTVFLTTNQSLAQNTDCGGGGVLGSNGYNTTLATVFCLITWEPRPELPCTELLPGTLSCPVVLTGDPITIRWMILCPFERGHPDFLAGATWFDEVSNERGTMQTCDKNRKFGGIGPIGAEWYGQSQRQARITLALDGFRVHKFDLEIPNNASAVVIWNSLRAGFGNAPNLTFTNGSYQIVDSFGVVHNTFIVVVTDLDSGSDTLRDIAGTPDQGQQIVPPIEESIVALGCGLGACTTIGKTIWGMLLWGIGIFGIVGVIWYFTGGRRGEQGYVIPVPIITALSAGVFGVLAYTGFFPAELIVLVILGFALGAAVLARSMFPSGGNGGAT